MKQKITPTEAKKTPINLTHLQTELRKLPAKKKKISLQRGRKDSEIQTWLGTRRGLRDWLRRTTKTKHSGTGQWETQTIRHMRVMGNRWKQSGNQGRRQTGDT